MKIAIIGAGSVGTNLHHALQLKGVRAELVHARPLTADPEAVKALPQADCYIYTVADHVLEQVVALVHAPQALHLHTSGSMPISVFGADKPHSGILYFLQSFSREVLIDGLAKGKVKLERREDGKVEKYTTEGRSGFSFRSVEKSMMSCWATNSSLSSLSPAWQG